MKTDPGEQSVESEGTQLEEEEHLPTPAWILRLLGNHAKSFPIIPKSIMEAMEDKIIKKNPLPTTDEERLWAVAPNFGVKFVRGKGTQRQILFDEYGKDYAAEILSVVSDTNPDLPKTRGELYLAFDEWVEHFKLQPEIERVLTDPSIAQKNAELNKVLLPVLLKMLEQGYNLYPTLTA